MDIDLDEYLYYVNGETPIIYLIDVTLSVHTCQHLCQKLRNNSIKNLTLRRVGLNPEMCKYLCQELENHETLEYLSLEDNMIGNEGCVYIGKMLEKNKSITELDLTNNFISDGCVEIAKGLLSNQTLSSLHLYDVHMTSQINDLFFKYLSYNDSLKILYIHLFTYDSFYNVNYLLKYNTGLEQLYGYQILSPFKDDFYQKFISGNELVLEDIREYNEMKFQLFLQFVSLNKTGTSPLYTDFLSNRMFDWNLYRLIIPFLEGEF